jgi:hypothetical protein
VRYPFDLPYYFSIAKPLLVAGQVRSTQGLDSWLTRAANEIINAFFERVFWGPKRVFVAFCIHPGASARKISPGFWPLTWRGEAQINHVHGATKFGRCGDKNIYDPIILKRPCNRSECAVTGVRAECANRGLRARRLKIAVAGVEAGSLDAASPAQPPPRKALALIRGLLHARRLLQTPDRPSAV